jgi:hypothetical protein
MKQYSGPDKDPQLGKIKFNIILLTFPISQTSALKVNFVAVVEGLQSF